MLPDLTKHSNSHSQSDCRHDFVRAGFFYRNCDTTWVQRFRCKLCKFTKSISTDQLFYRQRRRNINAAICLQLCSGVSQRRCALILPANRKTVVRKFRFFADFFELVLKLQNNQSELVKSMQFDDLETFEHTKCKPLSVTLAVENDSRRILGFEVSRMPCKGRLAKISIAKYGKREDERGTARDKLFLKIKQYLDPKAIIESDDNPHYTKQVKEHFPECSHFTTIGGRGKSTGQGELKRKVYDPLFAINHTFAKLRDDIKRMARKSWCTTKIPDQLRINITMMAVYHNYRIMKNEVKDSKDINVFHDLFLTMNQFNTQTKC